jgi:antitoxin ParD1/3/4
MNKIWQKFDKLCHNDYTTGKEATDPMATMNISLPDSLKEFIEARVTEGGYSTSSEYFRDLVREDQKRRAQERLEALLLEGLNSGEATPMTEQDWEDIRREVRKRAAQRNSPKARS